MNKIILLLLFSPMAGLHAQIQTCTHTHLSKNYNFRTKLRRIPQGDYPDSCIVALEIMDKANKNKTQKIVVHTTFLFDDVFKNCNSVRSYTTGINRSKEAMDNDYGDLVVADLNFDSKEDLALKKDSGGNGGPLYNFYIQDDKGRFELDSFLTQKMEFFPTRISQPKRTLVTLVHAGAYSVGEHTYTLGKNNKWKETRHRFLPVH